jgi:hypothetical protein
VSRRRKQKRIFGVSKDKMALGQVNPLHGELQRENGFAFSRPGYVFFLSKGLVPE